MNAVNLYTLTRDVDGEIKSLYEKALSQRDDKIKIREEEYELIRSIINNLIFCRTDTKNLEDWFYSFTIPQIGKEFDLLKIGKNYTINIELKSQEVSEEKIIKQLTQNCYYLSHISKEIYSFTYMKCEDESAKLLEYCDGKLKERSFEKLMEIIKGVEQPKQSEVESLFRPQDYLISPLNTPEKFLHGQYYLNNQQGEIKKKIIDGISRGEGLWGICGSAGTGKALLLYDIAKALAENFRICVIHCGMLSEGHLYLNTHMDKVSIIDAKSLSKEILDGFEIICIDESQRLYTSGMDIVLTAYSNNTVRGCIFSYDFAQALSKTEVRRNNPERLAKLQDFHEQKLTTRIRTNKEIYSFIRNMMRLYDRPQKRVDYKNIDIVYANDMDESDRLSRIFRKRGYTFITFTPSQYVSNTIDHYSAYMNSHQVIGQEFDNVVLVLDNNFRYSKKGELEAKEHPNPDYLFPRLFFQNISRAREKLCIIVLGNMDLFKTLLMIKENELEEIS